MKKYYFIKISRNNNLWKFDEAKEESLFRLLTRQVSKIKIWEILAYFITRKSEEKLFKHSICSLQILVIYQFFRWQRNWASRNLAQKCSILIQTLYFINLNKSISTIFNILVLKLKDLKSYQIFVLKNTNIVPERNFYESKIINYYVN